MIKRRNYTFALTRDNERVIKIVEKYPKYAYIKHDKDDAEVHYHYYIEFPNPRSIDAVARDLDIPTNMLEAVYNKRGILEYLTHENAQGKHHYDASEVRANFDLVTEVNNVARPATPEERQFIINSIADYDEGKITYRQLVKLMEPLISPTFTAAQLFNMFIRGARPSRNVGACPTFRVPSSITSVTGTKKKGGDMT